MIKSVSSVQLTFNYRYQNISYGSLKEWTYLFSLIFCTMVFHKLEGDFLNSAMLV